MPYLCWRVTIYLLLLFVTLMSEISDIGLCVIADAADIRKIVLTNYNYRKAEFKKHIKSLVNWDGVLFISFSIQLSSILLRPPNANALA